MQKLLHNMLERYDIPLKPVGAPVIAQFGSNARLLAVADRLIEASGLCLGIACSTREHGEKLRAQEGLFTVLVRGYKGEEAVREECVVQVITLVEDDLSDICTLKLGLLDTETDAVEDAARFLRDRYEKGLPGLKWLCVGERPDCAEAFRDALGEGAFAEWLRNQNTFYPVLLEGLAYPATAKENAAICADMNYADSLLHLAEPFALMTIQADEAFRKAYPLDRAEGVAFTDNIGQAMLLKQRIFDTGLFTITAAGYLAGHHTLRECMTDEKLRKFAGDAFIQEIIPALPVSKAVAAPYIISAFDRFDNPLHENRLLETGCELLRKCRTGALPVIEQGDTPRLIWALACTVMLLAGARPDADGIWTVLRGQESDAIHEDAEPLETFGTLSHDMPAESLAYAVLADRTIWGEDLREIDGLEETLMYDIYRIQQGQTLPE